MSFQDKRKDIFRKFERVEPYLIAWNVSLVSLMILNVASAPSSKFLNTKFIFGISETASTRVETIVPCSVALFDRQQDRGSGEKVN